MDSFHKSLLFLLFFSCLQAAAPESGGGNRLQDSWYLDGLFDARYTLQSGDESGEEQELREYLSLSFGEKTRTVTCRVAGFAAHNLEGRTYSAPYGSLQDANGGNYARLSTAYLDFRPERLLLEHTRIGRQWLHDIPELSRMDGVRVESGALEKQWKTRAFGFAGIPSHLNESSRSGDRIFGGGVSLRPFPGSEFTVLYARLRDAYDLKRIDTADHYTFNDDLLRIELSAWLVENQLRFSTDYSMVNGASRDCALHLFGSTVSGGSAAECYVKTVFETQNLRSTSLDPYVSVLRSYQPYCEAGFKASHRFTDLFSIDGGLLVRRLEDNRDVGPFNHEFERCYLNGTVSEVPFASSCCVVTANLYDTGGDRFCEVEGSYEQDLSSMFHLRFGTRYALYEEHRYTLEERSRVRAGFLHMKAQITDDISMGLLYDIEDSDRETNHFLQLHLRMRF